MAILKSNLILLGCVCCMLSSVNAFTIHSEPLIETKEYDISGDKTTTCGQQRFRCDNGDFIPSNKHCDRVNNCSDGSDEVNCSFSSEGPCHQQFQCNITKACISLKWRCDGEFDCGPTDFSDEDPKMCRTSN